jgi:hypothetical protein
MIDDLGRNIDSGLNAQDLRGLIASLVKQNTGPAKPFNKKNENIPTSDALMKDMQRLSGDFKKTLEEVKKITSSVRDFIKSPKNKKSEATKIKNTDDKKFTSTMIDLARHGLKKGSIFVHDAKLFDEVKKLTGLYTEGKALAAASNGTAKTGGGGGGGGGKGGGGGRSSGGSSGSGGGSSRGFDSNAYAEFVDAERSLNLYRRIKTSIGDISRKAAEVQEAVLGFRVLNEVTKGLIVKDREFAQEVRQVAYETAGVTKESRGLQHAYEDIGKTSKITGFDREQSTKSYLGNLRKGIKDQKLAMGISKAQLNTEKMIGVQAGTLADQFSSMSLSTGMNARQMAQFGRSIQDTARNTGVTGDNLANAVKQSDQFIKNLRNGARLTTTAAGNMVEMMASAEKFGVSEQLGSIAGVATKGLSGLMEASSQQKALLYQAAGAMGATSELMSGTLLSTKDGMKKLAGGMESILGNFGITSLDQIANMSDEQKSIMDMQLRSAYGMGLGEFKQSIESLKESSKGLDEKLSDITAKQKQNLTLEEQRTLMEQKRSLMTGGSLGIMSQLDEVAKSAGSMDKAFEKFGSKLPGMDKDLKALGITATDSKGVAKQSIETALKGINEGLRKAKKKELNITSSQIENALKDPVAFREISDKMSDANAELGVTQKSQVDALTDVNQSIIELNDTLRNSTMGSINAFLDSGIAKFTAGVLGGMGGITDILYQGAEFLVGQKEMDTLSKAAKAGIGTEFIDSVSEVAKEKWKSMQALAPVLGNFGQAAAAAIGPIAAIAAGVIALVGGVTGAMAAAEHAAEIFGTSQEKLTTAEYYAAKGAGAVTGALNYLTFGIFDSLLGSTGTLTIALAKFNKMIPILSAIMVIIDSVLGVLWGIATSIVDIFMGIGEMVYFAIAPIGSVFVAIGDAVGSILGPLFNFNSKMEETGSFFTIFANIFGGIGKAIRTVLRVVGMFIGGIVSLFTMVLAPVIRIIGKAIGLVTSVIGMLLNSLYNRALGILQFFEGVFTLNLGKIFEGMGRFIGETLIFTFKVLFIEIPKMLLNIFVFAFKVLFIEIPKMILNLFMGIPRMLYDSLASLATSDWVGPIFQPFLEILSPISDAMGELYNAFGSLFDAIGTLLDPIFYLFESIFGVSEAGESGFSAMNLLKGVVYGLSTVIGSLIRIALFPLQIVIQALVTPINAVVWVINQITSAINGLVSWAKGLVDAILSPFKWLYDILVGHSIIPDLATSIVSIFGKMAFGVIGGMASMASNVIGGMAKMATNVIGGLTNLPSLAVSAVGKVKGLVGDALSLSSNLFSGFVKGFSTASGAQEGFFSSISKGFSSMMGTSGVAKIGDFFKGVGSKIKDTFSPLAKGYSRSREQGGGILSSLGKGLTSQVKSTSTGRGALNVADKGKNAVLGTAGNLLGGVKGKAGKLLGGVGSIFGSMLGGGDDACACSAEAAQSLEIPLSKGMKNLKNQNAKSLGNAAEKIAGKSSKGFLGGLKNKVDSGIKSGKGLVGSMFGKAGGAASKAGGILSKGTGLMSGLFGKASGVAAKAGSLFSKGGGLMGSMFGKAGGFIAKAGLGGVGKSLLKKLPGIGALAGAGFALSALVQGNVGGAVKELASGLAGAIPFIGPVLSAGIDFFGDGLISGAGKLAGSAWEGAKSIASSAWEGAKNLGSTLWEGTKNLGSTLWESAKNLGSTLWDGAKTIGKGALSVGKFALDTATLPARTLASAAGWAGGKIAGFFGGANKAAETGATTANKMSMPNPVYPLNNTIGSVTASTARMTDIGESIQRDTATSGAATSETSELSTIAESGQTQVEKLENMITLLEEMVGFMKPSQSSGDGGQSAASTATNYVSSSPPKYYKWKTGKHGQGSSKGITSIGTVG